jgi:hypothetical protein
MFPQSIKVGFEGVMMISPTPLVPMAPQNMPVFHRRHSTRYGTICQERVLGLNFPTLSLSYLFNILSRLRIKSL